MTFRFFTVPSLVTLMATVGAYSAYAVRLLVILNYFWKTDEERLDRYRRRPEGVLQPNVQLQL